MAITQYESVKRTRQRRLAYKHALITERGCEHCGETDPVVLQIHHPVPSEKHPTLRKHRKRNLWSDMSFAAIEAEIDKCVVLCANCHLREERGKATVMNSTIDTGAAVPEKEV